MNTLGMIKSGEVVATKFGGFTPLVVPTAELRVAPVPKVPITQVAAVMLTHAAAAVCCFSAPMALLLHTVHPVTGAVGDVQFAGIATDTLHAVPDPQFV